MEILKQGNPQKITYQLTCDKCGCVFFYTQCEIKRDARGQYVECPTCTERMNLNNAKKVCQNPDRCDWCVHATSHGWEGNECTIGKWQECKTHNWKHFQPKQA
jgi:hypothetical protein